MTFKKLALASAIASLPMAAMAVDSLDDSMLSGVTGQDGIQVTLDVNLTTDVMLHDKTGIDGYAGSITHAESASFPGDTDASIDGVSVGTTWSSAGSVSASGIVYVSAVNPPAGVFAGNSGDGTVLTGNTFNEAFNFENDGAIIITGMGVTNSTVVAAIDAGSSALSGGATVLNVNVNLSAGTTVTTGAITVGDSRRDEVVAGVTQWGVNAQSATIIESSTLVLGSTDLNIQLANEPQGHMIRLDTVITGTGNGALVINNMELKDLNGLNGTVGVDTGSMGAASIAIGNSGNANTLDVGVGIDVDATLGLVVTINQLGDAQGANIRVADAYVGSQALGIIGDLEMNNLTLAGTQIFITGK